MSETRSTEAHEASQQEELEKLQLRWSSGDLAHHASQLMVFAEQQREAILALADGSRDPQTLIFAIKKMVVECGSVHHPTEMQAQLREIHDYIWYHGEKGEFDRDRIARDWASHHAGNWRRWRLKEYLFVIDQQADEILERFRRN